MMAVASAASSLAPGLRSPVMDSQRFFRAVLTAMAEPGRLVDLADTPSAPAPLAPGAAAVLLTLADLDTPVWLDPAAAVAADYLRFHCGCPVAAEPDAAAFALVAQPGEMPPLETFHQGDQAYPDRSATVIIQVAGIRAERGVTLRGPGIAGEAALAVDGLPPGFWTAWSENHLSFPLGVDVVFVAGGRIAGLPRSAMAEE